MDGSRHVHRRGAYASIHSGISYGGGQMQPDNLKGTRPKQCAVRSLLADARIRRILNFANGAFKVFAPKLQRYYQTTLDLLCQRYPSLKKNSPGSCFTAATFNLGPQTATFPHLDHLNLPWGWCAVTALANFNHARSGQVVLWNVRKVIEVPSGATFFIPSGVIEHSNLAVQPGEERLSITQYSAGALFRWVECGFCRLSDLSPTERADVERAGRDRWVSGVAMLSTASDLTEDSF
ncbi:hypothetical protein C8Q70DRAFT_927176 [Cubamyces menziesii]|nr:hypothetical protein C8Q70DRAFT_927176 [Cubamyces menziesii]